MAQETHRQRVGSIVAIALGALLSLVLPSAASADLHVSASGLNPAFRQDQLDYTVSCTDKLKLKVRATGRTEARIGAGGWFSHRARARTVQLEAGQAIEVSRRGDKIRRYWIRCLPEDFLPYTFKRYAKPSAPFYIISPLPTDTTKNRAVIFDRRGVPVWWSTLQIGAQDATVFSDGTIAWTHYLGGGFGNDPNVGFDFHRPGGKLVRVLRTVGSPTDNHEIQRTPDGNYMMITYKVRSHVDTSAYTGNSDSSVYDGVVQKISPSGKLLWQWSTADHIGLAETGRWWSMLANQPYDIVHMNAVQPLRGGDILVSMRHTDAVYRVDGKTGDIEWKLGGTPTPESLSVVGDPFGANPLGGQHDVRMVDGTVTVHDNGTFLNRPPRAVRYRISGGTAHFVQQVTDPLATVSYCCGSARYYPGDRSWLMSWGSTAIVTEFNGAGKRTFLLQIGPPPLFSYRAQAVRGELTRRQLVSGMNRQVAPAK